MLINTDKQPQSFENTHATIETGEMHETEKVKQKTWSIILYRKKLWYKNWYQESEIASLLIHNTS